MAENNTEVTKVAINDIGTEEDFIKAVDSTIKNFDDGDLVEGTVVKIDHDEVLLDIGYKTEGVIPSRELSIKKDVDPDEVVEVGDTIEALVVTKEDKEGRLILSKKRAQYERAWGDIEKIKEADGVVEGTVIEAVKGGLIVDIGLRGFLPASLVEMRRVRDLSPYIGQKIKAKILELDKNRNNVVLSRRQYLEETQSEVRETFLSQLKKGQIREGVVSSIVNFGAFVDLGGVDGLIHVSELSWKHIDHPSEVVKVGDKVTVEVLDVDLDRERISLSLKATQEDPWQRFARTHVPGQIVKGKVTKIVQFGVFISVEDGIEGLVHISELANRHVENPETVVKPGEEVFVKVIDVDLDRRRISLSLKQANDSVDPDEVVEVGDTIEALVVTKEDKEGRLILSKKRAQYERAWGDIEKIKEADGVVEGTVIEAVKGGLIVDIGLRGFLPASLVEMRRVRDLSPYIGQKIKAKILELDKNRNNVVLSRRQYLEETQSEVRETFLSQLKKGQIREGVVSSIVNFGAFVDLGGVDGLIHVSELSWKHIDHPSEVVKVGDKVTVEVLDVDLDRERISLSLKATQEDPWQRFARTHVPGQIVKGKVTKIVQFGVFISVEDGIEGLVHISELANRHVENPETVVKPGETVFVKVIDVDLDRRRISLSLKQANDSVDPASEDFDPAIYGMPAEYDEQGNYKYPEGFDPNTNEWIAGY